MSELDDLDLEPPRPWWERALRMLGTGIVSVAAIGVLMMVVGRLRAPSLPEQAPAFTVMDLQGHAVSLSDFAGQTVVLNFWATWCGPCRIEAPSFAAFARAHPDVPVLGMAVDGPPHKVRKVARDLGMTYPILQADGPTVEAYRVGALPTTVVVGPDGRVQWVHAGMMFRPQLAWATGRIW